MSPKLLPLAIIVDHSIGRQTTVRQSSAHVNKMNEGKLRITVTYFIFIIIVFLSFFFTVHKSGRGGGG